jgi:hypothetical protein
MHTNPKRIILRTRRIWREMDRAQRRLFELQTGVSTRPHRGD